MREQITTLSSTDKGALKADKAALQKLDWFGKLLIDYRAKRDELKFIHALLENQVDGKIHISIKVPGTISTRCSSGKIG